MGTLAVEGFWLGSDLRFENPLKDLYFIGYTLINKAEWDVFIVDKLQSFAITESIFIRFLHSSAESF